MLYTRKGDNGTTKDFASKPGERKSKSSCQTEALGAMDELNSFLGLVKIKAQTIAWTLPVPLGRAGIHVEDMVADIQNNLFSVQAELAGADKRVGKKRIEEMEAVIDAIEKDMPPIKTFFISGGTECAALFDISRTLARKAERRVVAGMEAQELSVEPDTLSFLNRLSSLLYACARYANYRAGVVEKVPWYN